MYLMLRITAEVTNLQVSAHLFLMTGGGVASDWFTLK